MDIYIVHENASFLVGPSPHFAFCFYFSPPFSFLLLLVTIATLLPRNARGRFVRTPIVRPSILHPRAWWVISRFCFRLFFFSGRRSAVDAALCGQNCFSYLYLSFLFFFSTSGEAARRMRDPFLRKFGCFPRARSTGYRKDKTEDRNVKKTRAISVADEFDWVPSRTMRSETSFPCPCTHA